MSDERNGATEERSQALEKIGKLVGDPHIAVLEGKTPMKPDRDPIISLEREREIADHIRQFLA